MTEHVEWYRKHRPKTLDDLKGQEELVKTINGFTKKGFPHAIMFTGNAGTGKTSTARILKKMLRCSDLDFMEVDAADTRGIDMVREIKQRVSLAPIGGPCRMWVLDEIHMGTSEALNSLLKLLEDPPETAYFILCTTNPRKIIATVRTRCTEIKLNPLSAKDMILVLTDVLKKEKVEVDTDVLDRIVEVSEGSARKAIVILQQIHQLKTTEEQLDAIANSESKELGIELARLLIDPTVNWSTVAKHLKQMKDEDAEQTRRLLLSYASSVLLNGGGNKKIPSVKVLQNFERNFFDSGYPGLVFASWAVKEN